MTFTPITAPQLRRLQTLCSQSARHLGIEVKREDRLTWASRELQKPVASFSAISSNDAKQLIDTLQASFGIRETTPPRRRAMTTRDAQKAGTEGRGDQLHAETTMLDGTEDILRLVRVELTTLGWDEDRLRRFLRSPRGPNKGRDTIHTLGDANRVHWALKKIAARAAHAHQPQGAAA